jgi:oxygen-independent coproporphyrinogen-3 oxidase
MMTGLRLTREGVSAETFHERFGQELQDVFGEEIDDLIRLELLERIYFPPCEEVPSGVRVRLTRRGRLLGNQVFMCFVG